MKRWVEASSLPTTSHQQAIIGLTAFLTALCVFMFLLRVASRLMSKKLGIGKSKVHLYPRTFEVRTNLLIERRLPDGICDGMLLTSVLS